jgi:hypothetical protein
MQPLPEREPVLHRGQHIDRANAGYMLVPDLAVDAAGLDEANLQAAIVLAKTDKHCSGTLLAWFTGASFLCHYGQAGSWRVRRPRVADAFSTGTGLGPDMQAKRMGGLWQGAVRVFQRGFTSPTNRRW